MNAIIDSLSRAVEQLLGRSSGPLHLRLIIQPVIASIIAIKAGLRDARQGYAPFFWTFLTKETERRRLVKSGWTDIGKIFVAAFMIDTAYQIFVLGAFYILQALIVAVVVAVVPYVVLRSLVDRFSGRNSRRSTSSRRAA